MAGAIRAISWFAFALSIVSTAAASVDLVPTAPTGYGNCIPFGTNVDFGFSGLVYRNVPAFVLNPGDSIAFDMAGLNDVDIRRNIYFAPANINPAAPATCDDSEPSQSVAATAWTQVVSDAQVPANPLGNLVQGDYELTYLAEASFNFPGGGFIVGFGGSPPGAYADTGCEQMHVNVDCSDPSGFFYSRFFLRSDQSLGVLDDAVSLNDSRYHHLAGMRIIPAPVCGNGDVEAGETCDDSNVLDGDCCSSTCQYESNGSPCAADGDDCTDDVCDGSGGCGVFNTAPCDDSDACTTDDQCDGSGTCTGGEPPDCDDADPCTQDSCDTDDGCVNDGSPIGGCRLAGKSLLILKNKADDEKDQLKWKWLKGAETMLDDFGDPTGTTNHTLCVYAGASHARITLPAGASRWQPVGTTGFKFESTDGLPHGARKALLKSGATGKAKALLKGKGGDLPDLMTATLPLPLTVQLVNDANAVCFEAAYDMSAVLKNDGTLFKGKTQ